MGRSKKSESSVVASIDTRDESSSGSTAELRSCIVVADSPVAAKLIAEHMPQVTFPCTAEGILGAVKVLESFPTRTLFVLRGSKAIEVVKG